MAGGRSSANITHQGVFNGWKNTVIGMLTLHSACYRNIKKKNAAIAPASNLWVNQSEKHTVGKVDVAVIPSKVK